MVHGVSNQHPDAAVSPDASAQLASPELEALEAFLGSNPEALEAFLCTPFAGLSQALSDEGFDSEAIRADLSTTGILDSEAWLRVAQLPLEDFLALTPLQFAERYPETGAPLVAAVLSAIEPGDQPSALMSIAGGTNLSKRDKIGIGVGVAGAAVVGGWAIPRMVKTARFKNKLLELLTPEQQAAFDRGEQVAFDLGNGSTATLSRGMFGITNLDYSAGSLKERLITEWNQSLGGNIRKIAHPARQPEPEPEPDPDPQPEHDSVFDELEPDASERGSSFISERPDSFADVQDDLLDVTRDSFKLGLEDDAVFSDRLSEARRSLDRFEVDPEAEINDLGLNFQDVYNLEGSGENLLPKDGLDFLNGEVDQLAVSGLKEEGDAVLDRLGLDDLPDALGKAEGVVVDRATIELNSLKGAIGDAVQQDVVQAEKAAKNELMAGVDHEVNTLESGFETAAQGEARKADQFIENSIDGLESDSLADLGL